MNLKKSSNHLKKKSSKIYAKKNNMSVLSKIIKNEDNQKDEVPKIKRNKKTNRLNEEKKNYIKRVKNGNSYSYFYKSGEKVSNKNILEKISHIYIAPAYKNVKIFLNSDLLATGIDDKGRKQYVYSEGFKKKREQKKYCQMMVLSDKIEKLEKHIEKDLKTNYFSKEKLIAIVLKIIQLCNFRSGQKKMEKKYKSHGITTVHKNHVDIHEKNVEIEFIGKKGVNNHCRITDKPIQDIVKKIYKLSTKNDPYLFSIKNEKGENVSVSIYDLNEYLRPYQVTTKDLRTWNANILFLKNLYLTLEEFKRDDFYKKKNPSDAQLLKFRKKILKEALIKVAHQLHNTPTVCKNSYIYKTLYKEFEEKQEKIDDFKKLNGNSLNWEKYLGDLLVKIGKNHSCK
jgi:DNA topoisomerase-1